jgi:hypothetical protein
MHPVDWENLGRAVLEECDFRPGERTYSETLRAVSKRIEDWVTGTEPKGEPIHDGNFFSRDAFMAAAASPALNEHAKLLARKMCEEKNTYKDYDVILTGSLVYLCQLFSENAEKATKEPIDE